MLTVPEGLLALAIVFLSSYLLSKAFTYISGDPETASLTPPTYPLGTAVTLVGLKTASLNGETGHVSKALDATGRIGINLSTGQKILARPSNVEHREQIQPDWWPAAPAPRKVYAKGDRIVVTAGSEKGRHGKVIVRNEDVIASVREDTRARARRELDGLVAARLDEKQDLHLLLSGSLEFEPDLSDLRRPWTVEEAGDLCNSFASAGSTAGVIRKCVLRQKDTPLDREAARTYELLEHIKESQLWAPVDYAPELKAYLKRGEAAPLMQSYIAGLPMMVRMAMPDFDSRGMPVFKNVPDSWSMDMPPWVHPSKGGSMVAFFEYEREMEADMARGTASPSMETLVRVYEYAAWRRALRRRPGGRHRVRTARVNDAVEEGHEDPYRMYRE